MIVFEEEIKPVRLTEELLKKTELYHKSKHIHNDAFSGIILVVYVPEIKRWRFMIGSIDIRYIDYVHQLQNLYFALTGEELTLK